MQLIDDELLSEWVKISDASSLPFHKTRKQFIAMAYTAVPTLIAEVRRLRAFAAFVANVEDTIGKFDIYDEARKVGDERGAEDLTDDEYVEALCRIAERADKTPEGKP